MKIYILKHFIYDCSSDKLDDVKCYVFKSVGEAQKYAKKLAYEIWLEDEDSDDISFEEWDWESYDFYYEIIEDTLLG